MSRFDYIICNAIAAEKNAPVPQSLLKENADRIFKSAEEMGAEKIIVLIDEKDKNAVTSVENAAKHFRKIKAEIRTVDAAYGMVMQEPTAIIRILEGEKPLPFMSAVKYPVFTCEFLITKGESKTVYIGGHSKNPGKYSFTAKISPKGILEKSGDCNGAFKAMYFGWPSGIFIGKDNLDKQVELASDFIYIADGSDCVLDLLLKYVTEFAFQSCGKCVFCREGTNQMKIILSDISGKKGKNGDIDLLLDLCSQMKNQVICTLGVVAASAVESAIRAFREEIENHIIKKSCKALACRKFITYHILPDKCTGCQQCEDVCEEEAISGKKNYVHVIDQDDCVQCGKCADVCKEGAVVKAGAIKPKSPSGLIPCINKGSK